MYERVQATIVSVLSLTPPHQAFPLGLRLLSQQQQQPHTCSIVVPLFTAPSTMTIEFEDELPQQYSETAPLHHIHTLPCKLVVDSYCRCM